MTEQQQRFNAGKPKHSYFFASETALKVLYDALGPMNRADPAYEDYSDALHAISAYLGGDDYGLQDAATGLMIGLQVDAADKLVYTGHTGMCAAEFLAHVPAALEAYAAVCEYGEAKYARGNYRKGAPVTQYLDSALRHLLSRLRGELNDPESGKPHGGHALWNVIQAMEQPSFRDDRLPPVKQEPDPSPAPAAKDAGTLGLACGIACKACEPDTFGVDEAELRMRRGRTVHVIGAQDPTDGLIGNDLRFDASSQRFEFILALPDWSRSSFPESYENCRFVEVV